MAHPLQGQALSAQVSPGVREAGVQPAHADIGQEEMLIVPGLAEERDTRALTHRAVSSVAAH